MRYHGSYIGTYKRVLTASAVSGLNLVVRSAPGWGKTSMAYEAAKSIAGNGHSILMRLHEATSPDEVQGRVDIQKLVNGSESIHRIMDGTPYDPEARIVILDEFSRCEQLVYNLLLHATERIDMPSGIRPIFWATTNWMVTSDKTEALRDRFGLWYHIELEDCDYGAIAIDHLDQSDADPVWNSQLPDWNTCLACRAEPVRKGVATMIADMVNTLAAEARNAKLEVNPRRAAQWGNLMWRVTYYESGLDSPTELSSGALAALMFAYPAIDESASRAWQKICMSVSRRVEQAVDAYLVQVRDKFVEIANSSAREKSEKLVELGQMLAEIERQLTKIGGDSVEVRRHIEEFNALFARAAKGESIL